MDQPDRIHLRDYVLAADIGAFQSERGHAQRLRFNLSVDLAHPVIGVADDVDRILSYDVLTDAIAAGLADQRYNLLETLAEKIAAEVLAHPRAALVEVTVEKLDRVPGALGVTLHRRRGRVDAGADVLAPVLLFYGADVPVPPDGPVIVVPDAPGLPLPGGGGNDRHIALLALDQQAWALAARLGLEVADSRTELDWAVKESRPILWAPARMAADVAGLGADPVALSLWLARRMGAARVDLALPHGAAMPTDTGGVVVRRLGP